MRFVLIENNEDFPNDGETCWYWDTDRPVVGKRERKDGSWIAVQCYCKKDPNQFRKIDNLRLLFTDQTEYYCVCPNCYDVYRRMQWSGSTHGGSGWRSRAENYL